MVGLNFFLAAVVMSLQVAQDGVHSCALRNHKTTPAGPPLACSTPGAADPSSAAFPHRTPASCATPTIGLQYPVALNKISSISPVSFSQPNPFPAVAPPPVQFPSYLTSVSSTSGNHRILVDLLLEYFAATVLSHRLPSLPPSNSTPLRDSFAPSPPAQLLPPVPYHPATPNLQNGPVDQEQLLSLLLSVSGPGSEIINPAVPSDRSLSPLPSNTGTPPLVAAPNAIPPAPAPVDVPKATSPVPEAAPAAVTVPPLSSFPATDPESVPANAAAAAVPTPDPVVSQADFVNASDSSLVAPTSGPASSTEAAPVTDAAQAADDSVSSASTSAIVSLTTLPPADTMTSTIVV